MNFHKWMMLQPDDATELIDELEQLAPDPAASYTPSSTERDVAFSMGKRAVVVELLSHLRRLRQERAEQSAEQQRVY